MRLMTTLIGGPRYFGILAGMAVAAVLVASPAGVSEAAMLVAPPAGISPAAMLVAAPGGVSPATYGGHLLRPQSPSASNDYLLGVAAFPGGAWAVGRDNPPASVDKGVIERWNGRRWRLVASPDAGGGSTTPTALYGVAAASAANAWAVGSIALGGGVVTQTLIDHWNGRSWRRVPSPNPGGAPGVSTLAGVAALSRSSAWAVGSYLTSSILEPMFQQTLIERWNGTAWEQIPSPSPGPADSFLLGVTAISPSSAWAVGAYTDSEGWDQTLIEQWNGKTWKQIPSPSPGGPSRSNLLFGVAAMSPANAFAVGVYVGSHSDATLIEHWNGRTWKQIRSPNGPSGPNGQDSSFLYGVAALSPSAAWAVGTYDTTGFNNQTLIERWNGRTWKRVPSPNPGGPSQPNLLTAVAVGSPSNAWAAGNYYRGGPPLRTLTEHWNGRTWKTVASPNLRTPLPGQ